MVSVKNVLEHFITNGAGKLVVSGTVDALTTGQIAVVDLKGTVMTQASDLTTAGKVRVAYKGSDVLKLSNVIDVNKIISKKQTASSAAVEQVTYVGYNGTSGSFDVTGMDDNLYAIYIDLKSRLTPHTTSELKQAWYQAVGTPTQVLVAAGLNSSLIANFSREPEQFIRFERTGDGTVAAYTAGTAKMVYFTKGSKVVAFTDAAKASANDTVATGAVVNFPSTDGRTFTFVAAALAAAAHVITIGNTTYTVNDAGTAQQNADAIVAAINAGTQATATNVGGTSTTVTITYNMTTIAPPPVVYNSDGAAFIAVTIASGNAVPSKYVVASGVTAGASFTLDVPFQGETGYAVIGTTAASMSGIATVTNYGIKMTGLPLNFQEGVFKYEKARWEVSLKDCGDTAITYTTGASEGIGTYEQVAEMEWFAQFSNKDSYRLATPPVTFTKLATSGSAYGSVILNFYAEDVQSTISASPKSYMQVLVHLDDETATTGDTAVFGDLFGL